MTFARDPQVNTGNAVQIVVLTEHFLGRVITFALRVICAMDTATTVRSGVLRTLN